MKAAAPPAIAATAPFSRVVKSFDGLTGFF